MPVTQFGTRAEALWSQQDPNAFTRYQVWYANQQIEHIKYWSRWQKKYATMPWKKNVGSVITSVSAEPSAISTQKHVPNYLTEAPRVTEVRHFERTNTARTRRHLWQSPLMHFLPSFLDFRTGELDFASSDLTRQIAVGNDQFVRWQALQMCKWVYVVGKTDPLVRAPYGEATSVSEPKNAAFWMNMAAEVGSDDAGFLTYKQIVTIASIMQNQLGIIPWSGLPAEPSENSTVKGKYILTGDGLIYDALAYDEHVLSTKSDKIDYINSAFTGQIGPRVAFLQECHPLRYLATDGSFPAPEIEEQDPNDTTKYEKVPNPPYAGLDTTATNNANIGIAFMEGHQPFESISVGPPPKEFASGAMSMKKFNQLDWSGTVRLTDNLLVNYGSSNIDTNKWGEWLQLIADTTMGLTPKTARNMVAIVYRINHRPALAMND